jgi:hypothetical protein
MLKMFIGANIKAGAFAMQMIGDEAWSRCRQSTRNVAMKIFATSQDLVPVRSGALRASGRVSELVSSKNRFVMEIAYGGKGTEVDYAVHVEIGTVYQEGQFYLLDSVEIHAKELKDANLTAFGDAWNRYLGSVSGPLNL